MVAASNLEEPLRMTEAEYLAFEEQSEIKHELSKGKVYALSEDDWNHDIICVNINTILNYQLLNRDCVAIAHDLRVKATGNIYRYPDVVVLCGEPQFVYADTIDNPNIIMEVWSESTALVDHDAKLSEYIRIPSLKEYLLIAQNEVEVQHYWRRDTDNWFYRRSSALDASLDLPSLGCKIPVADIYQNVTFDLSDDTE